LISFTAARPAGPPPDQLRLLALGRSKLPSLDPFLGCVARLPFYNDRSHATFNPLS
jgi:hypothetical protein